MSDGATIDLTLTAVTLGVHRIRGLAPGDSVSIEFDSDAFTKVQGVDGEGYWIKIANTGATMSVSVIASSLSNDVLSGLHLADKQAPGGLVLPFKAGGGPSERTSLVAARARITKFPPVTWSDSGPVRVWPMGTTTLRGFIGGVGATTLGDLDGLPTTPG